MTISPCGILSTQNILSSQQRVWCNHSREKKVFSEHLQFLFHFAVEINDTENARSFKIRQKCVVSQVGSNQ